LAVLRALRWGSPKIVFFVALVLFIISLIAGGMRGGFGRRL